MSNPAESSLAESSLAESSLAESFRDADASELSDEQIRLIADGGWDRFSFARRYTQSLLEQTPCDRWFEISPGHVSNVAWQVGHLTVASYGLLLFRIRGRAESDLELIPSRFRKAYGKGSRPNDDVTRQPSADELLARLSRVVETARSVWRDIEPSVLREPVEMPYAVYPAKLGCLMFAPMHEMLHAGQIGSLRRGLGLDPIG